MGSYSLYLLPPPLEELESQLRDFLYEDVLRAFRGTAFEWRVEVVFDQQLDRLCWLLSEVGVGDELPKVDA